jgi:hypothetical protein
MPEQQSPDTANALAMWQRKAIKRLKESGSAVCEFISEAIQADDHDRIADALATCQTPADVKAAFARPEPEPVVDQMRRALDWLEAHA